ncbi:MAG: type II toxin-antitoxin system VapC family toxin [Chloroflexi bacterium]|nr:type II toxin-antitoxin system VapC family toxin [Chloroflexota bacterium]
MRVYADTSVFGGIGDSEYEQASRTFFDQVRNARFELVTSAVVQNEIESAPDQVRELFDEMLAGGEMVPVSEQALQLQKAYLESKIVTPQWAADALHVALATVSQCAVIVSWNFRHIVHFKKIPLYNAVNTVNGYTEIAIHSPLEVIGYEE